MCMQSTFSHVRLYQTLWNYETLWTIGGEGNGTPLQCSCLENPRNKGVYWVPSMGSHSFGHDRSDLAAAWTIDRQAPLSMGCFRQEY